MNRSHSPHSIGRTLLYLAAVGGLTSAFSYSGISWKCGKLTLVSFPEWPNLGPDEIRIEPEDVEALLADYVVEEEPADTLESEADAPALVLANWLTLPNLNGGVSAAVVRGQIPPDSARARAIRQWVPDSLHPNLQLTGDSIAFTRLWRFFESATAGVVGGGGATHVLHYGDSQIEGDRITSELRYAFQQRWGGRGPGYVSAVPQSQVPGFVQAAEHWTRYTAFGKKDSTLGHERFGLLATAGRPDEQDTSAFTPPLVFRKRNLGHRSNRVWDALHILTTGVDSAGCAAWIQCDATRYLARIEGDSTSGALHVDLPATCDQLTLRFEVPAPDINAIGFFADSGVVVHNVPMRGSSGTIFRKADRQHWTDQMQALQPGLILLQYGGNVVPYVEDVKDAEQYARWLASQIDLFQTTLPDVPIVLIGPSDMSMKSGLDFVTYPQLLKVRAALKSMAWEEHVLYWDLFTVMGGVNAMPAWVQADPPLAAADHIHFTAKGAKRVGALLGESFGAEFDLWQSALLPMDSTATAL